MGKAPCCDRAKVKRGPWSPEEDTALRNYLQKHGNAGNWISLPQKAGLRRCGKSCRLRWLNYLRPDIKHGGFTDEEDNIICTLYQNIGSRWSVIASQLPGRTDNDVKNYWNTKLKKKLFSAKTHCAANASHIQLHTSSSSPASGINCEDHGRCFLNSIDKSSSQSSSADVGVEVDPPEETQLSHLPSLNEASHLGLVSSSNFGVFSSSSSPPVENSCSVWSDGGNYEADSFFMDMGFGSATAYDLLHQTTMAEIGPDAEPNFSYSKLLNSSSDSKYQVLADEPIF